MSDLTPGSIPAAPETVTVGAEFGDHDAADAIRRGLLTELGDLAPSETPKDSADEAEDGAAEKPPTGEEDGQSEPQDDKPAAIEPPKSWSDEDKAEFGKLPPAVQKTIAQRESDRDRAFTQKTEEVANERKATQAAREAIQKETAVYQQTLQQLAAIVIPEVKAFEGVDWARLAQENPAEFVRLQGLERQVRGKMDAVTGEWQRMQQLQQQAAQKQYDDFLADQSAKLTKHVPFFVDPEKGNAFRAELKSLLANYEFTPEEVGNLTDYRTVRALARLNELEKADAARKTAEATRKAAELKATPQNAPRVQKPGIAPESPRDAMNSRDKEMTQRFFGADKVTDRDAAEMIKRGLGL